MSSKHLQILAAIALTFTFYTASAQDCKYDVEKADPISGKKTKTIYRKLDKSWKMAIGVEDRKFTLGFYVYLPGDTRYLISEGDTLVIKLESGEIINLNAAMEAPGSAFTVGAGNYMQILTSYTPTYRIKKALLRKIVASNITALRFYFGTTPVTLEVPEKNARKISSSVDCMLSDLPPLE